MVHYRGYGGSSGRPSEGALVSDALAVFDRVHARHRNVLVIGRSLGSGVAIQVAAARPLERLVLVTPFDSLATLARGQFPVFPTGLLLVDRFDSVRYAPLIHAPTTLIAAGEDEIVPRRSTLALLEAFAPGVANLATLPGKGHDTISMSPDYLPAMGGEGPGRIRDEARPAASSRLGS
jgi:hypothetical protein